jgi:hypothetical protein
LIRGAGEMAGVVARSLSRPGLRAIVTEIAEPLAMQRTISFCEEFHGDTGLFPNLTILIICLGPGFAASQNAHLAIKPHRGRDLGRLIYRGQVQADMGQLGISPPTDGIPGHHKQEGGGHRRIAPERHKACLHPLSRSRTSKPNDRYSLPRFHSLARQTRLHGVKPVAGGQHL